MLHKIDTNNSSNIKYDFTQKGTSIKISEIVDLFII